MGEQMSTGQLLLIVLGSNAGLVAAIVFILQKFGPNLFNWMRAKIDEKNGSIKELVEEVKKLSQAMCDLVRQGNLRQDEFVCDMREIIAAKDRQIDKLVKLIEEAAERAA